MPLRFRVDQVIRGCMKSASTDCLLKMSFFLCRYLTETAAGVILPPRIGEIGIKCLTVTFLQCNSPIHSRAFGRRGLDA